MTTKFPASNDPERGPAAGVQDPSLARAHVSRSLSLSLENGPRGRTLGVGEEPVGHTYRWPPISPPLERGLSAAYKAVTGRQVWRSVLPPLILAARLHGPDTVALLGELYREGGVHDLLARLIAHPPRSAPHPDYAVSTEVPSEAASVRGANPPAATPARVVREPTVDGARRGVPPRAPEFQKRTPGGLTPIGAFFDRWEENGGAPKVPGISLPVSTVQGDDRHPASAGEGDALSPGGHESSPIEPPQVEPSRPPVCRNLRHEPTWVERPDGTWRCGTCHP
jgi:hypothetical protein